MYISLFGLLLGLSLLGVGYGKGGQRRRRRGFIIAGWTVLGLQVFPVTLGMVGCLSGRVNWIEYKPTSWLLSEVASTAWFSPPEAYRELVRRLEAGDLTDEEMDQFATAAMARYPRTDGDNTPVEIRALNALRERKKLAAEHVAQFFEHLVDLQMQAQTPASAEEGIPIRLDIRPRSDWSDSNLWCTVEITPADSLVDGDEEASPRIRLGRSSRMHRNQIGARRSPAPDGPLLLQGPTFIVWQAVVEAGEIGKWSMTCDVHIDYFDRNPSVAAALRPIHTVTKQLSVETEVVDNAASTAAKLVTDLKYLPELLESGSGGGRLGDSPRWQVACYHFDVIRRTTGDSLRISLYVFNTLIGCAFDATIHVDGVAHDAGTIAQAEGQSLVWILEAPYPKSEPETVTLKLTPNQELASGSADLPEIWGKPIEIKDIPRNRPVLVRPYVVEKTLP